MSTNKTLAAVKLDEAIERILDQMSKTDLEKPEYAKMADQLTKLYRMREIDYNFELKEIDGLNKQEEIKNNLDMKKLENLTKQQEIDANRTLKEFELRLKEKETDSNCKLKNVETEQKQKEVDNIRLGLSMDTWAVIGANLAGIVVILGYERVNIVTSKALGFVSKLR